MNSIDIFCIEGSGASSTDEYNIFRVVAINAWWGSELDILPGIYKHHSAFWPVRRRRFLRDVRRSTADCALLIGKSLGAVRLYQELKRSGDAFSKFKGVRIVTVDPHSPFPSFYSYDKPLDGRPYSMTCAAVNVYQADKWPTGATVTGSKNVQLFGEDHWSIVRHPFVAKAISSALYSLAYLV